MTSESTFGALLRPLFGQSRKGNSPKFAAFRGFCRKLASPGTFIADSSALARVLVGWVYLLSSSFSFPELLVGFPRAHPLLLPLFTRVPSTTSLDPCSAVDSG